MNNVDHEDFEVLIRDVLAETPETFHPRIGDLLRNYGPASSVHVGSILMYLASNDETNLPAILEILERYYSDTVRYQIGDTRQEHPNNIQFFNTLYEELGVLPRSGKIE